MCLQQQRVPLRWYPPEYFKSHFYGFKGDVWAFGIVLWEMQTFGEWEARRGAGNPQMWVRMCGQESVFDLFTTGVACFWWSGELQSGWNKTTLVKRVRFRHAAVSEPGDVRGSCVPHQHRPQEQKPWRMQTRNVGENTQNGCLDIKVNLRIFPWRVTWINPVWSELLMIRRDPPFDPAAFMTLPFDPAAFTSCVTAGWSRTAWGLPSQTSSFCWRTSWKTMRWGPTGCCGLDARSFYRSTVNSLLNCFLFIFHIRRQTSKCPNSLIYLPNSLNVTV